MGRVRSGEAMHSLLLGLMPLAAGCVEDLDALARKVEQNYAGYHLEVLAERRAEYDRHLSRLRAQASGIQGDDCYFMLRSLVSWFNDPHLFIFQSTRLDSAETASRAAAVERTDLTEDRVRAYLSGRRDSLDPLEGIWFDGKLRVAIVPRGQGVSELIAVVLTSDTILWPVGSVRAWFARSGGQYEGEVWERNFAHRRVQATLHKRVLLRLSPGIWGKEFPLARPDSGLVDSRDPHRATMLVRGKTLVLSIPSHDPTYRRALDSLIDRHAAALRRAERLIVDLRGNEGGSSATTTKLMPYIASTRQRPPPLPDKPAMMLSSADQIAYVQRTFVSGRDTLPATRRLLARLRTNLGRLVPLEDSRDRQPSAQPSSISRGPARVGIIVDRGTVSAAEAFLVRAMRSTRVTVFGENTAGALDYLSVAIVPFQAERPSRWLLGYPTIAAHAGLPAGGIRGSGLAPQVRLDLEKEGDVVGRVEAELSKPRR